MSSAERSGRMELKVTGSRSPRDQVLRFINSVTNLFTQDLVLPPGPDPPEVVFAIVEIPKGGRYKYEYDLGLGLFRLDRVLYSAVHYPACYGFIPGTNAEDGDPMDILVMTNEPTLTVCLIEARPVGLLRMQDEEAAGHHGVLR